MKPSFLPSPKMSLTVMALAFFMTSVSLPSTSIAKSATSGSDGPVAAPCAMEKPAPFTVKLGPNPAKASTVVTISASKKSFNGEIRIQKMSDDGVTFLRWLYFVYTKRDIKVPAGKSKSFTIDTSRHKSGGEYLVHVTDYSTGSKSSTRLLIK